MKVKVKLLDPKATVPTYAKGGDAGLDLVATGRTWDSVRNFYEYSTGIALEIPEGYVGLLFPRSSVSKTDLCLANCVGVVDSGYRGEIKFRFKELHRDSDLRILYNNGDKIGQLIIMPYPKIELDVVEELSNTDRSDGGFGSTGE